MVDFELLSSMLSTLRCLTQVRMTVSSISVKPFLGKFSLPSEDFPLDAQAVIDYFEDTYIGRLRPGGHRRVPLFELGLSTRLSMTYQEQTMPAVEGWHRSFQANVRAYHPNFWKFIDILEREQNLTQVNIAQARAGHQPDPQRRRYLDSNQRIKNIVRDYHNRDIMQYLRA